jgi:hypothetical protein
MTTLTTTTPKRTIKDWLLSLVQREAKPYTHPYKAGILLGLVLFGAFFITGNGLGASGGINRFLVVIEDALYPPT